MEKTDKKNTFTIQRLLLIAVFALLAFTFWQKWANNFDGEALFNQYYQPYKLVLTERDHTKDGILTTTQKNYDAQKYAEALPVLEGFLRTQRNATGKLRLGAATCLINMGQSQQAISHLDELIRSDQSIAKVQAQWYKALLLIRQKDGKQAKALLEEVSFDPYSQYRVEAKALLEEL